MKNLCYDIDSNLNEFPFLLYQYGLFERLHVEGVGIDRTFRLLRKPTSPQVVTQYIFHSKHFRDSIGSSLTNEQYIVLLLTICELHVAYKHEVKRNVELFHSVSKAEHEYNILCDILAKNRINKSVVENTNMLPSNRLFYSLIDSDNIFPSYKLKVVLPSLISRISSDENQLNTGLWFTMESTQFSRNNTTNTKLFALELPKILSDTKNKEFASIAQEDARAMLNLLFVLHQNYNGVLSLNAALEKQDSEYGRLLPIQSNYLTEWGVSVGLELREQREANRKVVQEANQSLNEANYLHQSEISSKNQEIKNLVGKVNHLESRLNDANKREELQNEYLKKLQNAHNDQLQRLKNEYSDNSNKESLYYNERIKNNAENYDKELVRLNSQIEKLKNEHLGEIEKMRLKQVEDIEKTNNEHRKKTEEGKRLLELQMGKTRDEINTIKNEYEKIIDNVKLKHKKELEEQTVQFQAKAKELEDKIKSNSDKYLLEIKNISNSFQRTIETLASQNSIQDSEIKALKEQNRAIRQDITNIVVSEKILDSSNYSTGVSQWERTFFDELAVRLHQLSESESKNENQLLLLDMQRWANETKLNLELQKSEQVKLLAEIASSNLSMQSQINEDARLRSQFELDVERTNLDFERRQLEIENRINNEGLERERHKLLIDRTNLELEQNHQGFLRLIDDEEVNRKKQDLKIEEFQNAIDKKLLEEKADRIRQEISNERAIINIEQRDLHIQSQLKDDAIERAKHELKVDKMVHLTEQKIDRDSLEREKHLTKMDSISLDVQRQKIENLINEENIKRKESELLLERNSINVDRERMMVDFIRLQNELKSEALSIKEFSMQKTLDYQRFELQTKENILRLGEMINLQEANNLKEEKSRIGFEREKLDVANKLAEVGLLIREQEVHFQKHLNEIEQNKIGNEKQLLEVNKGKLEVQEMLTKNQLDFQRNQNELNAMLLKMQEGKFKNEANELFLELNKKHFENEVQLQSLGLTQRENEVELRKRENDIRSVHLTNQGVVNHLLALQRENKLYAQMEEERRSFFKHEQSLEDRIWSLQNSLVSSQTELSNQRALNKYLK